ncbi:conserved phage C-terminal domain-containing protein [Pantoea agglomerans]|uniref:conserved phage C-terminal domain-containing protein n=1 Tax=Enterobacter agglomerans TaxID=549 RepID=UPI000DAE76A0|nr:conserved phage C-terminal domain-containing protein [Pantoea agglomerans]RAH33229.1 GntR family transcriptional regulator [Pantoea agglomerans]TGX93469.1 GntR family transcriptional regulator [Pantoea agglomerans]
MSVKLSAFVWDGCASSGMKITMVAIMARLADFSSDEGVCWPSIATIARQIGAGPSTVRTSIRKLESEGWLTSTSRRKGNRNNSNMYQLNIKKLRESAAAHLSDSEASESDTSKYDTSKSDAPNFDASIFHPSESSKNTSFDPPESGDDPSVNSKHDPSDKKPLCQVASQPDDEWSIINRSRQVLRHLNKITGAKHTEAQSSMGHIKSRLKDSFTVEELCLVVEYKHAHWEGTEEYQYMRPKTLFIPGNLPGYLQSATKWDKAGRPPRSEWNALKRNMQRDITVIPQPDSSVPHGFRG